MFAFPHTNIPEFLKGFETWLFVQKSKWRWQRQGNGATFDTAHNNNKARGATYGTTGVKPTASGKWKVDICYQGERIRATYATREEAVLANDVARGKLSEGKESNIDLNIKLAKEAALEAVRERNAITRSWAPTPTATISDIGQESQCQDTSKAALEYSISAQGTVQLVLFWTKHIESLWNQRNKKDSQLAATNGVEILFEEKDGDEFKMSALAVRKEEDVARSLW